MQPRQNFKVPFIWNMEFEPHSAQETAAAILDQAIVNFPNRKKDRLCIPDHPAGWTAGFSVEALLKALGGTAPPYRCHKIGPNSRSRGHCGL